MRHSSLHLNPPLAVTEIETKAVDINAETKAVELIETTYSC